MSPSYCVICRWKDSEGDAVPRIVGPFATQAEAVEWAYRMRGDNRAWTYTPDVMQVPS